MPYFGKMHIYEKIPGDQFSGIVLQKTQFELLFVGVYFLFLPTCSGKLDPCANNWLPLRAVSAEGNRLPNFSELARLWMGWPKAD